MADTLQFKWACEELDQEDTIDLKIVGNVIGKAVQLPQANAEGKIGGTLHTTFIDLTEMRFVLIYKPDASKIEYS